ncbi:MAG: ATP-grasp domain-containing protein [Candidatus Moranbacteria bacterium]|nr:ATP-grasp domain-containing protein [Candidatus Moranbacteria bacterium]
MITILDEEAVQKKIRHGGFRSLLKRAVRYGIEVALLSEEGEKALIRMRHGGKSFFMNGANAPAWKLMTNLTRDKEMTKLILNEVGVEVPKGFVADSTESALRAMREGVLRYPVILKPTHGSMSRGVSWDIRNASELRQAIRDFRSAKREHDFKRDTFLVEEMFVGREYRLLVFKGSVIACTEKTPASVTGTGVSTVRELIEAFNDSRPAGYKLRLDEVAMDTLKRERLTTDSVVEAGRTVRLRNNMNMTDGGRAINSLHLMHPSFRDICIRSMEIAGLDFAGIDFLVKDISAEAEPGNYVVLEVNCNPYYNMHEAPLVEGGDTDVSSILLEEIFPSLRNDTKRHDTIGTVDIDSPETGTATAL